MVSIVMLFALPTICLIVFYLRPAYSIRRAVATGDSYALTKCLRIGVDPNMQFTIFFAGSKSRQSLLHYAVKCSNPEACRILLEHGADPNSRDYDGMTPIMTAFGRGLDPIAQEKIFNCLLPVSDLSLVDRCGCSLLHRIALYGSAEQYETVRNKAPWLVMDKDYSGTSPLDIINSKDHK